MVISGQITAAPPKKKPGHCPLLSAKALKALGLPYQSNNNLEEFCIKNHSNPRHRQITRLEQGNYGDCEPAGEGLSELRMFISADYRVYIGEDAATIVVLLCGGA